MRVFYVEQEDGEADDGSLSSTFYLADEDRADERQEEVEEPGFTEDTEQHYEHGDDEDYDEDYDACPVDIGDDVNEHGDVHEHDAFLDDTGDPDDDSD